MTEPAEQLYEQVLVLRCQAQDTAALEELIARYDRRLRYYLRKWAGDASDDILQEVWFDAWRGIGRLEHPGALAAWLYTIARRHAMARLRRAELVLTTNDLPHLNELADDANDEPTFSPADAAAIHAALDRLTPAHREVLVLRFLEEMSYDDMARVVGCEIGTIKSRLHYAKQSLRAELEPTYK
jgi:RNA polymerase sigma-70 factor (ECF subfamily)